MSSIATLRPRENSLAALLLVAAVGAALGFFLWNLTGIEPAKLCFPLAVALFSLLALIRLPAAILVYLAAAGSSRSWQFFVLRGKSTQGGIFLSQVFLVILLFTWMLQFLATRRSGLVRSSLTWPLLALAFAPLLSLLSTYITWDPAVSTEHRKLVVQLAGAALVSLSCAAALLVGSAITNLSQVKSAWRILAPLAALAFLDMAGILHTPGRIFAYAAAPLAFSFSLHSRSFFARIGLLLLILPPLVMSVLAIKFTLIVAVLFPLLAISFVHSRRAFLSTLCLLALGYALLFLVLGTSPWHIGLRKVAAVSDLDRVVLFRQAISIWKGHWLFGIGPGGQFAYFGGERYYGTAHSLYANFLLETGVVGIIALLWLLGRALSLGPRLYRQLPDSFSRAFVLGQWGGLAGLAAAGLLSDTLLPAVQNQGMFTFGASVYSWLLLGFSLALPRLHQQENGPRDGPFHLYH